MLLPAPVLNLIMMFWSVLAAALLAVSSASSQDLEAYIVKQGPIAKTGLLANIGPSGSKSHGAAAGVVVASPSTENPDYVYVWVRDASLVFQQIIEMYTHGVDDSLRSYIDDFVGTNAILQQTPNPSGEINTGGLGEPKFHINRTAFTGSWGRPQRDGPALRASALTTWAYHLLQNNNDSYVFDTLWPTIKLDFDYTQETWNRSTFDLWEEVSGASFFTTAAQHKALRQGITLARALKVDETVLQAYSDQADNLLCFLQSYWDPTNSYITANVPRRSRSGLDSNTVLASLHTFDPSAGCDATTFQPCSDKALANLFAYVNEFREGATKGGEYAINKGISKKEAIATGRYPEDVYYSGNPWYLTTLAAAEQLYYALHTWETIGKIQVTDISFPFFKSILGHDSLQTGSYASTSLTYNTLISAVKTFADGFVKVVAKYTPEDGSLAEQYERAAGTPLSAKDLTWSYASVLTAFQARAGTLQPKSWGAKGLKVKTGPDGQCVKGPAEKTVQVTFKVRAETVPGENVFVVGSVDAVQNWDTNSAVALSNEGTYPVWSVTVSIPVTTPVEYKYIKKSKSGAVTWESDPNRRIVTPGEGETVNLDDEWR